MVGYLLYRFSQSQSTTDAHLDFEIQKLQTYTSAALSFVALRVFFVRFFVGWGGEIDNILTCMS